jgi:hypothetical protein
MLLPLPQAVGHQASCCGALAWKMNEQLEQLPLQHCETMGKWLTVPEPLPPQPESRVTIGLRQWLLGPKSTW